MTKALGIGPLVALRDSSFAFYISQMPVMAWVGWLFRKLGYVNEWLHLQLGAVLLLLVSPLVNRWYMTLRQRIISRVQSRFL